MFSRKSFRFVGIFVLALLAVMLGASFVAAQDTTGTEVEFERRKDAIVVRKSDRSPTRGRQLAERLKGRGDVGMTTDEIMALTRGT